MISNAVIELKPISINNIGSSFLCQHLSEEGVLLFRDVGLSFEVFSSCVSKCSKKIVNDPARSDTSSNTQLVDAGYDEIPLHIENGNTPFLPQLLWFFCEKAARRGSETTYCDGEKVWHDLKPSTQKIFLDQRIRYRRRVHEYL